jgi:hypothetical protein
VHCKCLLSGVKRTCLFAPQMSGDRGAINHFCAVRTGPR